MPATYTLIASNTLSSAAASVTFSAIPGTYTDLVLKATARTDGSVDYDGNLSLLLNNESTGTNYSVTRLTAEGTSVSSNRNSSTRPMTNLGAATTSLNTSNTFANFEFYFPNYTASTNKPISNYGVTEQNQSTNNFIKLRAGLWSNTAAITEIKLTDNSGANFVSGSSFFLYGIKNS